jgi:hypothetical protein
MPDHILTGREFGDALAREGLIPPECHNAELLVPAKGLMVLRFEKFVRQEDLAKVGRAIASLSRKGEVQPTTTSRSSAEILKSPPDLPTLT